jgi:hypothetical protein
MHRNILTTITAIAMVAGIGAQAADVPTRITANDLNLLCQSLVDKARVAMTRGDGFCLGYIVAIVDSMAGGAEIGGFKFCPPLASPSDMANAFRRSMSTHPEMLTYGAPGAVAFALSEAYPCH